MVVKVLIVEDQPLMVSAIYNILALNTFDYQIEKIVALNCQQAYEIITNHQNNFEVVFIDYSLPPCHEKNLKSGVDVALLVKKHLPGSKIIFLTSHVETILLYDLFIKTSPDGIFLKSELHADELLAGFNNILNGEAYFTAFAKKAICEPFFAKNILDEIDRKIITAIAKGHQINTIANDLGFSVPAIKKRKSKIAEVLNLDKPNDEAVLEACRRLGFIVS